MKVDYPSDEQIKTEINLIVDKGMNNNSFFSYFKDMLINLGLKNIFYDIYDILFLSTIIITVSFLYLQGINLSKIEKELSFLFTFSPILYSCMFLISLYKENQLDTFDIKMVCKYTVYHLLAFKMAIFSLVGFIINFIYILSLSLKFKNLDFWTMLAVSISSLSVFSVIMIFTTLYSKRGRMSYFVLPLWIIFNLILWNKIKSEYILFLQSIPIIIYFLLSAVLIFIYIGTLKKMILQHKKF